MSRTIARGIFSALPAPSLPTRSRPHESCKHERGSETPHRRPRIFGGCLPLFTERNTFAILYRRGAYSLLLLEPLVALLIPALLLQALLFLHLFVELAKLFFEVEFAVRGVSAAGFGDGTRLVVF